MWRHKSVGNEARTKICKKIVERGQKIWEKSSGFLVKIAPKIMFSGRNNVDVEAAAAW